LKLALSIGSLALLFVTGAAAGGEGPDGVLGNAGAGVSDASASGPCAPPAPPWVSFDFLPAFCSGTVVTLTSSSETGNQWYLNGNPIGGATAQQYHPTVTGDYTATVTANGCTSAPSASTSLTVKPIPAAPTITPAGPTTVCTGGSVTLTSSSASENQWYWNGGLDGSAQQNNATAPGSYTVTVTVDGCTSPPSAPTIVTQSPFPAPRITNATTTTFCAGGSVTFTSSSATGNQWNLDGRPIAGAGDQQYTASASGTYTVMTAANGCTSRPVPVWAIPNPPTPVITAPRTVSPGSPNNIASVPFEPSALRHTWTITNGTLTPAPSNEEIGFTAGFPGILTLSIVETTPYGCVSPPGWAEVNVATALFHPLTPCRLLDTRDVDGPFGGPAIEGETSRTFVAAGRCGVPSGAAALSVNVTVTQGSFEGHVAVHQTGVPPSAISIIHYRAGQTIANNGILVLGAGNDFVVHCNAATSTVHVIVDVNGYFR